MALRLLLATGLFLSAFSLSAQVRVEIVTEQDQFLPNETMVIGVRIVNQSGQVLKFGTSPGWLTFNLDSQDNILVHNTSAVPVAGEFELESSMMGTKRVDLAPHYDLIRPGRYRIRAIVKIEQWNQEVASEPKVIDIVRGGRLWEAEFGVPYSNQAGAAPESRKYVLEQARFLKDQIRLYVRVSTPDETEVFKVVTVGPMVSFSRPEVQIDKQSRLHILQQSGRATFNYHVLNPDGSIAIRQTHEYSTSRPVLRHDKEGGVGVQGGVRKPRRDDLPEVAPATAPVPTAAPAPTSKKD